MNNRHERRRRRRKENVELKMNDFYGYNSFFFFFAIFHYIVLIFIVNMTTSSHPDLTNTCERPSRVSFSDHFREYIIEPIVTEDEAVANSHQRKKSISSKSRSCLTIFNHCWRTVCRTRKSSNDQTNPSSEETIHSQQQVELEQIESNVSESTRRKTLSQDCRRKTRRQHLFPFRPPYRTIKITDKSSVSIACSDQHILLKQKPNLCLLDKQLVIIKEISWTYDHVDMCWSSTLNRFILTTEKIIFTLDEKTMKFERCPIYIDNEKEWSCGTCSDTSLFLSTGDMSACLYEYTLRPTMEFVKEWPLCNIYPKYEGILTFTCANGKLALVISNLHIFKDVSICVQRQHSNVYGRFDLMQLLIVVHLMMINGLLWNY